MVISNNATAGFILGTLNKNINKKSKAAGQLALGEKIRNAGDDASSYAISERMRVCIRSLDQADANVQNGASMLRVAEGAIQSQINLLRTVKAKVIDAHNDTNTDADRAIIQKEISQYYDEINDIAAETTFNGKHLLLGTKVSESVKSWYRLDHAEKLQGSDDFGFISGSEATLDGYTINTLSTHSLSGGTADVQRKVEIKFDINVFKSQLDHKAFRIKHPGGAHDFVFAFGTNHSFNGENVSVINLNLPSTTDVVTDFKNKIGQVLNYSWTAGQSSDYMTLTLTTIEAGEKTNDISLYSVEGVFLPASPGYEQADPITNLPESSVKITNIQQGADGATASWSWDLSAYNSADMSKAEEFISQYVGQAIQHSGNGQYYEFIDSSKAPTVGSISKINGSTVIDLNNIRSAVNSGKTVSEAFADMMISKVGSLATAIADGSGQVTGIKFNATVRGTAGNSQKISFVEGDLRDYTLDFKTLFDSKGIADADIAAKLDGKGFRFYEDTTQSKWVNVLFVNGVNPNDDERPPSGGRGMDIDTLVVDLSDVTDFNSFLKTLYQGDGDKNPEGLSQLLNRTSDYFRLLVDYDKGTMTIYDNRRYYVANEAKIADGVLDNVVSDSRNSYVNDLVIQHTDKSSANIHVRIPQTTMDQIFGYKIGDGSLDDYSVMTSDKREFLLGQDYPVKVTGALDKGLQYLIDANTLIGSQIVHMEFADANIVTQVENTKAAESVIRDADMAKSAMDMAKYNILAQSAQAMLSQFNHNSSDVLNLLQ
ncbi:flagellin [Anaerovibrio sp.]|uniref:flagellin n=1 Tax=Anaerovibrio sp. TaxID=1872532 RepID=UPI0025C4B9EA|nr:flagellin [Anaerovibrio sp.]